MQAAVLELQRMGVRCELKQNAVPRMYYADQISRHIKSNSEVAGQFVFHQNVEECDYVLHLPDSHYDVAFLKTKSGEYVPVFDDYEHGTENGRHPYMEKLPIKKFLGAAYAGKVEHWSGARKDTEQTLHSIGKLLQEYTVAAATNAALAAGHTVLGRTTDKNGTVHLTLGVA